MQNVRVKDRGGIGVESLRPVLVWLAVAVLLLLAGCGGSPAAAGDPEGETRVAGGHHPTAYPASEPASDEVVLKWNGTLILPGEAKAVR